MWSFKNPLNLLRYLIVLRINCSKVWVPKNFSTELSLVLGKMIAERLSTSDAQNWRKALAPLEEYYRAARIFKKHRKKITEKIPDIHWPVNAVLLEYPGKTVYGEGECLFWELKLCGKDADHGFFLEVILPALEALGYTGDPQWERQGKPWGHFDIRHVFVAHGLKWEPLIEEGRLDLRYFPRATQWAEGVPPDPLYRTRFARIMWFTPFDLAAAATLPGVALETSADPQAPTVALLMAALTERLKQFLPRRKSASTTIEDIFDREELERFQTALAQAQRTSPPVCEIHAVPNLTPGCYTGKQFFYRLSPVMLRFLELASIVHIGGYTHFGCGTFLLTR